MPEIKFGKFDKKNFRPIYIGREFGPHTQRTYWAAVKKDFVGNVRLTRWLFVGWILYTAASSLALWTAEQHRFDLLAALYFTWTTMTTVGNANATDFWGRLVTGIDVFIGLLTFGFIVWLVTSSLNQNDESARGIMRLESTLARMDVAVNFVLEHSGGTKKYEPVQEGVELDEPTDDPNDINKGPGLVPPLI